MKEIKILQEKLKQNPDDLVSLEEYAILLSDIGENEEALKNFVFLNEKCPDNPKILYNIGIILEKLKYFDKAIVAYEKAYSLSNNDIDVMYNLANVYIAKKRYTEAEELLLKVISIDNYDENSFFHLGEIYSKQKKDKKTL